MKYMAPQLNDLLAHAKSFKEECAKESPSSHELAALLDGIGNLVESQLLANPAKQEALHEALLGAYLYVRETKFGILYNTKNPFFASIEKILKIDSKNEISARDKLIYINQFHALVAENKIGDEKLLVNIRNNLSHQLSVLTNPIAAIVNAIPTELSITEQMDNLPQQYKEQKKIANSKARFYTSKPNKSRIFLTQLAKAISTVKCEDEANLPEDCFTRSQRIKMGMLLYIEKSISNTYLVRSADNSVLHREASHILNISHKNNLDEPQQLACLNAFLSYINDHNVRGSLEEYGRKQFGNENLLESIDTRLDKIASNTVEMQCRLEPSFAKSWPATTAGATIGAIIGAVPGYGIGAVTGALISQGRTVHPVSEAAGRALSNTATFFMGPSSSAGFYAIKIADCMVASTITRGTALLLQLVGVAAGGAAGGLVGFTVDLTAKGLQELCNNCIKYNSAHPGKISTEDMKLIQCLMTLPEGMFAPDKQNQIRCALGDDAQVKNNIAINKR